MTSPSPLFIRRRALQVGACLLALSIFTPCTDAQSNVQPHAAPSLGPDVIVFDPTMPTADIQTAVNKIAAQQIGNQFGTERYTLLFKPGTYGSAATPLNVQVGFYTEVAGLGASPDDTVINGTIYVLNQCDNNGCTALDNFWRSMSNLRINVTQKNPGCYAGEFWAVSQAAPLRRVHISGQTTLMDYCTGPSYASGGFIADSQMNTIINGSQQQFYLRNSNIDSWTNGVWNQVFSGVKNAPGQTYPNPTYTVLAATPISREKPFLYLDSLGRYNVMAPAAQTQSVGITWGATPASTAGRSLPISRFFIADPTSKLEDINEALDNGKNLLLTPGIYALQRPIRVNRSNTIVLGLGSATLVPQKGDAALTIGDVDGVQVAGLIVDAGPVNSPVLLQVGHRSHGHQEEEDDRDGRDHDHNRHGSPANPVTLSDVFFRVGGATAGTATTSLEVNRDNTLLDDIWAWRADHGQNNSAGWTINTAAHGLVVNGDNVTATGLAVEHYQQEQVLWKGNGGTTLFYQSELPYDPPSQAAWKDGVANGYPSYVVDSRVITHHAYGLGIYSFFNLGVPIVEDNAMTVPNTPGVAVHDVGTVFLNGSGQITHVIDGVGGTVNKTNGGKLSPVVTYP